MPNDKLRSYLHFHVIVFIWGFTAVLGALITLDAVPLVWYRMLLASGFIYLWIKFRKKKLRLAPKRVMVMLIAGVVIAAHWLTFFGAIKVSNVSITLALLSTGAFFTSFLEPIFYKRKVIWYEILFGLVVICGLYIIFKVETEYLAGILLALLSAFLSAVFSLINGKLAQKEDASVISFYELLTGTAAITIYLLIITFSGSNTAGFSNKFFDVSAMDWTYLLILASVCTAYAFIASVAVMKHLSPYTIMLTINLEPVYGILLAFWIFGSEEAMNPEFYYGAAIILSTVILNGFLKTRRKFKKQPKATF
ncbi:EamA domain-containing membrane protein RarD [Salinimicrobium sediminis]|uniref:EamA domain-containing membrane protein RarD n=1 Tax=Salinimicrobium sediminis TaxID=1343891 RepID=A0A285WZI2_9FLAO|nr:DMT family transporter [Salinimicrobium sediminis]SOC78503.1 EamA domain-containing membrane protein RarD [Salinimicrobium sediminis]